jgi:hypothetical protein
MDNTKRKGLLRSIELTALAVLLAMVVRATPALADQCLKDAYGKSVQCTANDVSIAYADNPRNLNGTKLTQCTAGQKLSFVADFHVTTTATARENIGLYFQTAGASNALTGTCSDNIIAPPHSSSNSADVITLGTPQYQELDTSVVGDNCGDISTTDNNQVVTVEVDDVTCQAGVNGLLALPNCTSWQQPGGALKCQSPMPYWPWVPAAVPGSPSKCNCQNGFTVPIFVSPNLAVTKTCTVPGQSQQTACSMPDPGGTVTYTVTLSNSGGSATINQICDSAYGNIATAPTSPAQPACPTTGTIGAATSTTCSMPQTLAKGGGSYSCTFTATQGENTSVMDIATVSGVGSDGTTPTSGTSNSVTATVVEAATTGTITRSLVSTTNNCLTVRYGVDVKNTSSADETLTLSALSDNKYGDITKFPGGSVLGTTCGVASGLGTLSGTTGGGLFGTIAPSGDYTCQFDAQFCSPPGTVTLPGGGTCTGISNTDTVIATLTGDEGETVSLTPGTLTVDQCFTTYAQ